MKDLMERETFDSLPLTPELRKALEEMDYTHPTLVQRAAYQPAVDGVDLIVQARTGTGKTAGFGIPLTDAVVDPSDGFQALVLAPTRELAVQSAKQLTALGKHRKIRTLALYGGTSFDTQVNALNDGIQIVSGTPGRVLDHLTQGTLNPSGLRTLVLDEADEMLSMGFAEELNAIVAKLPTERQTLLFSATLDDQIQSIAMRYMKAPTFLSLSSDQIGAQEIEHFVYLVSGRRRSRDLVAILEAEQPESAIIFCNTKAETEEVARDLKAQGFRAEALTGDLPQRKRERVLTSTREGDLRFLVATDVASRGIDISHLTHVVNYSFPADVVQYIHRTGRTGRAGRSGTALSMVSPPELGSLHTLRLQYNVHPVERSLITEGEKKTQEEVALIAELSSQITAPTTGIDRAVARRILTHDDSERLVSWLVRSYFASLREDSSK